jgi:uncharacterized membrane protein YfcA
LLPDLLASLGVGLAGGLSAGLLGVSPGGALVVFSVLLLGVGQHAAQGISLVAQVAPTAVAGLWPYWRNTRRPPLRWLVILAAGFLIGGVAGAFAAVGVPDRALRWIYVGYLAVLTVMLLVRRRRKPPETAGEGEQAVALHWAGLLAVGTVAGFSSGFLGIGGGLATTVGLHALLGLPQHQAQLISLILSVVPTTAPAAWVYWQQGFSAPWPILAGVIVGLWVGTNLGARAANAISADTLHRALVALVSVMTLYMAWKALT